MQGQSRELELGRNLLDAMIDSLGITTPRLNANEMILTCTLMNRRGEGYITRICLNLVISIS